MIFSLSEIDKTIELPEKKDLDIFCFFRMKNTVNCPPEFWFPAISSSLKAKHSVLILEEDIQGLPQRDESKRWATGDNWCWLTPRSLSVITESYLKAFSTYSEFKLFLTTSK